MRRDSLYCVCYGSTGSWVHKKFGAVSVGIDRRTRVLLEWEHRRAERGGDGVGESPFIQLENSVESLVQWRSDAEKQMTETKMKSMEESH